jgi:hypothetical protein
VDKLEQIYLLWKKEEVTDAQMAVSFFLFSHLEKYPQKSLSTYLDQFNVQDFRVDILDQIQFKKIKSKAIHCLKKWFSGEWDLVLIENIPSAEDVLSFQAKGLRPVTMKMKERSRSILHREDALDFFCHDLEHGHMFFFDEELKKSQINFFQKMQKSIDEGVWDHYRLNRNFEEKFVYLISDMNTHPEHYKAYLYSMVEPDRVGQFDYLFE